MRWLSLTVIVVAFGGGVEMRAIAAPGDLLRTFPNPTPSANDEFGLSVAAVGNNILVGAWMDDTVGPDAGAAYLFDSAGNLLRTFPNPEPAAGVHFGLAVGGMGNNLLITSWQYQAGGMDAGAAYLYDGAGNLLQKFSIPNSPGGDWFGVSVAALGNNVFVGADGVSAGATKAGVVYQFDATTGNCVHTFLNPQPNYGAQFGHSIAVLGNRILIGAPWDNVLAPDAGAAYLFDATNGALLRIFRKVAPSAGDEEFGYGLAMAANNILITAVKDDALARDSGVAYLFDAGTGGLLHTILNPHPGVDDQFGISATAVGNNFAVGAYFDDRGAVDAGAAYLFDPAGNFLQVFQKPTPALGDKLGSSLAALGNNVIVGARGDDTGATDAGAAYLFEGVPEPSTLALLGVGAISLLAYAWRRRRCAT